MLPKNLDAVFLDFDGVVVESANIKTQAFYGLYLPYGIKVAEQARDYHFKNQGISRHKKFAEISKLFLNKACSEDEKEKLSTKFSENVFEKIMKAPLVEGVLEFLKKMQSQHIPVFLLSATPHKELLTICEERGILGCFKELYGAPYEKSEKGKQIINDYHFGKEHIIFVGDSLSDFKAASAMNVRFIGRVPEGEESPFSPSVFTVKDFSALIL
jgi:phosphoglycolate phosphatase-like HAD superfamily hydrolase